MHFDENILNWRSTEMKKLSSYVHRLIFLFPSRRKLNNFDGIYEQISFFKTTFVWWMDQTLHHTSRWNAKIAQIVWCSRQQCVNAKTMIKQTERRKKNTSNIISIIIEWISSSHVHSMTVSAFTMTDTERAFYLLLSLFFLELWLTQTI